MNKLFEHEIMLGMQFYGFITETTYQILYVVGLLKDSVIVYDIETKKEYCITRTNLLKYYTFLDTCVVSNIYIDKSKSGGLNLNIDNKLINTTIAYNQDFETDIQFYICVYCMETLDYTIDIIKHIFSHFNLSIVNFIDELINTFSKYIWSRLEYKKCQSCIYYNYAPLSISLKDCVYNETEKYLLLSDYDMQLIIDKCCVNRIILDYLIYEYDRTVDLDRILLPHYLIYSMVDDKFYILLALTEGESYTSFKYRNGDMEATAIVDFMKP